MIYMWITKDMWKKEKKSTAKLICWITSFCNLSKKPLMPGGGKSNISSCGIPAISCFTKRPPRLAGCIWGDDSKYLFLKSDPGCSEIGLCKHKYNDMLKTWNDLNLLAKPSPFLLIVGWWWKTEAILRDDGKHTAIWQFGHLHQPVLDSRNDTGFFQIETNIKNIKIIAPHSRFLKGLEAQTSVPTFGG